MRGLARLLIDMGRLFVIVALAAGLVGIAVIAFPSGGALQGLLARLTGNRAEPYTMFEPDELVYDNLLAADVPRIYALSIPRIGLQAPVVAVDPFPVSVAGRTLTQLHTPHAFAAGWSTQSAQVGVPGNTVLVGHNNIHGEVFKDLWQLREGDSITVHTASGDRNFRVSQVVSFEERDLGLEARLQNARWVGATSDERLTLVTCWPYWTNTHRLVVVALPAAQASN